MCNSEINTKRLTFRSSWFRRTHSKKEKKKTRWFHIMIDHDPSLHKPILHTQKHVVLPKTKQSTDNLMQLIETVFGCCALCWFCFFFHSCMKFCGLHNWIEQPVRIYNLYVISCLSATLAMFMHLVAHSRTHFLCLIFHFIFVLFHSLILF